jgi:ABC-type transporter Mla subunit MlaD
MSAKTNNFKLGLFTLVGLGLLITGIIAFGTWSSFEKKSLFETYVPADVSGLSIGSAVELHGVKVGKVTHIGFSWNEYKDTQPGCVVVAFEMKDEALVAPLGSGWREQLQAAEDRGLRARIKSQGVTGTCIVSLEYLEADEYMPMKFSWTPKHTYIPSAPGMFGELLVSLHKALRRFDRLDVSALSKMAETDLKSVGRMLDKVEKVDLDSLSTNANALLKEVRTSNAKVQNLLDHTDGKVKELDLKKLTQDANDLVTHADVLITQLQDTASKLEPGLTSIDFDSLNQTLSQARQAIQNMNDVLDELKKYPSGFIFGKPPPPLKELQPPKK